MINKNQLKLILGLKLKKNRVKNELFVAEGEKVVNELINSKLKLHSMYCLPDFNPEKQIKDDQIYRISESELKKISNLKTPNQVLALFYIPKFEANKSDSKLILALDDIRDPGNLGTIIRIADWFGINLILASENTVDAFNPKVVMSTMGSIARVSVKYCNLAEELKNSDRKIYGTFLDGQNIYKSVLESEAVIVIGNESNGISKEIEELVDTKITIPQFGDHGKTESLNAAVATAIVVSQFSSSI